MILLFCFLFCALVVFLLNEYYFHIVLSNTQDLQARKGRKGRNLDWVAFGSSYCRYGLESGKSEDLSLNGYNFGIAAQFFYYTDKMLREYSAPCLKKNGTVFIIIADLVFAEVGRGLFNPDRYQLLLSKDSLADEYSFWKKMKLRFPLIINPKKIKEVIRYVLKGRTDLYSSLEFNTLNKEQSLAAAKQRCDDWCRQFGLDNTSSAKIPDRLEGVFVKTRDLLSGMIQFCLDNGYKPFLVVTPVSDLMNTQLSDEFIGKVLYDNIAKANTQGVPLLDYLRDKRFQDISLYHNNADFLNRRGRRLFTKVLLQDSIAFSN